MGIPFYYYLIAVVIGAAVWKTWRWEGGLLVGYAFLVLAETVLIRKPFTGEHLRLELFWSWRAWDKQREQILTNVVMFVPVGVLCGKIWRWRGLIVAVGMSVMIEVLQLVSQRGLCEFDDVFYNMIGATVGVGIMMLTKRLGTTKEVQQ